MSPKEISDIIPKNHKLWFYGFTKDLDNNDLRNIEARLNQFTQEWESHGQKVNAKSLLVGGHLMILAVNNDFIEASGCSIDSSVALIRDINKEYQLDLFDRLKLGIVEGEKIKYLSKEQVSLSVESGSLDVNKMCVNETINNSDHLSQFIVPVSQSWLGKSFAYG
jgi:hypothetical protein